LLYISAVILGRVKKREGKQREVEGMSRRGEKG
jgi:hypothetical protein